MTSHHLIAIIIGILLITSFFLITLNTLGVDRIKGLSEHFKSTKNIPLKFFYFSLGLIIISINIFLVITLMPYTPEVIKVNYIPPRFGFSLIKPEPLPPYEYGFTARLEALPQGIESAKSFKDKMRYDANKNLLILNGTVLTKGEKDELLKLSKDTEYQKAVEAIFEKSKKSRPPPSFRMFLSRICRYIGFATLSIIALFILVSLSRRLTLFVIDRRSSLFYIELGILLFIIGIILSIIQNFLE